MNPSLMDVLLIDLPMMGLLDLDLSLVGPVPINLPLADGSDCPGPNGSALDESPADEPVANGPGACLF